MWTTPFGASAVMLVALIGVIVISVFAVVAAVYLIFFYHPGDHPPEGHAGGENDHPQN
jgi:hypothetical protein